jgi:hypothetical protein
MNYNIEWEETEDGCEAYVGDICIGGIVSHETWHWCESGTREDCDDYITEGIDEGKQWVEDRFRGWLEGLVG